VKRASFTISTLGFGLLLLLFLQTLTVWLESIYKIGLTKLSMGSEMAGLLFVLSPILVLFCPGRVQTTALWIAIAFFLGARALLPLAGVSAGMLLAGVGVGSFLVALCFMLSGRFRFLVGDAGAALGLAVLMSIALRAWGATYDYTLGASGAVLGWLIVGIAIGLFWWLRSNNETETGTEEIPGAPRPGGVVSGLWSVIGLFANFTVVYLVLSSPGVVEAWMGFDNTWGVMVCILAVGIGVLMMQRGQVISRAWLVSWNVAFGASLVGGILALRIQFPATAESSAVVVQPENAIARLLLNLMFVLSPVVLMNVRIASSRLSENAPARGYALPVLIGISLLVALTIMSIFTNVWGYVGPIGFLFRNQFHIPFLLTVMFTTGILFLPGWPSSSLQASPPPMNWMLLCVTLSLVLAGLAGAWHYRPVSAKGPGTPKQLIVLTYNLQQGADLAGNRNWENQLALIRKINPDIVGLQESDTGRPSNGNVVAAKYFGAKLGYNIYYGPNTVSGTYGTAILSRFPLENPRTFFTFSEQDEVGTAVVEFKAGGQTVGLFNSHPSGHAARRRQAEELVRQAQRYEYVIAVGDFNATPQEESYRIIAAQLKECWSEEYPDGVGLLHPELRPAKGIRVHGSSGQLTAAGGKISMPDRIDHIFVSRGLRAVEACYLPAPDSQTDHPAHWVAVTYR
jgi:endonuclease/exonuclease/phosphatase family metal-dependent hydrolase